MGQLFSSTAEGAKPPAPAPEGAEPPAPAPEGAEPPAPAPEGAEPPAPAPEGAEPPEAPANVVAALHAAVAARTNGALARAGPDVDAVLAAMAAVDGAAIGVTTAAALDAAMAKAYDLPPSPVWYVPVVERADVTVGAFVLAPGATIPLHDHPGMTVLSRVVAGRVTVASYDVVEKGPGGAISARRAGVKTLAAGETSALFADVANLHEIVAGPDGAVVLDVISPPYTDETRKCRYYHAVDAAADAGDCVALAAYDDDAPEFTCHTAEYRGLDPGHF